MPTLSDLVRACARRKCYGTMLSPLFRASCAFVLVLLQCTLLCAAPMSACCAGGRASLETAKADSEDVDCCPPGSHAPGQCPLHKNGAKAAKAGGAHCRMRCDASHTPDFVLGAIGVLPRPFVASLAAPPVTSLRGRTAEPLLARPAVPDAPPPKAL